MDIATIIITSLTLIAVGVGLYLNHKTNIKLTQQLKEFEGNTNQSIKVLKEENAKQLDKATNDIKNLIIEKSEQLNTRVLESVETICKSINNDILSLKTELTETFENNSTQTKQDIQNSNSKLQKDTIDFIKGFQTEIESTLNVINKTVLKSETEIISKIDNSFVKHGEQHFESLEKIEDKFQKVISEIKSPLSLD